MFSIQFSNSYLKIVQNFQRLNICSKNCFAFFANWQVFFATNYKNKHECEASIRVYSGIDSGNINLVGALRSWLTSFTFLCATVFLFSTICLFFRIKKILLLIKSHFFHIFQNLWRQQIAYILTSFDCISNIA